MNIYARYFDQETVATSFEELITFLSSISEIDITTELFDDIKAYIESPLPYPKRYKLRPRIYFILIKTTANSIQEFKNNRNKEEEDNTQVNTTLLPHHKEERVSRLNENQPGWYKVSLSIKRMILISELQKFQYQDNTIKAYIHAETPLECYNRLHDYISTRNDIDPRTQIPSAKSECFKYNFIGSNIKFSETR